MTKVVWMSVVDICSKYLWSIRGELSEEGKGMARKGAGLKLTREQLMSRAGCG